MKFFIQLFSYIILSTQIAFGQQATITGAIKNTRNEPIANASVYLVTDISRAIIKTTITDDNGEFKILDYPKGSFRIQATAVGFVKNESSVLQLQDSAITAEDIILNELTKELEAITVQRELPQLQNSNGKLIMNVENSSIAAGNNALEVLKRAPGVNVDQDDVISLMGQQGVNVTIDGRSTYMSADQLASMLKSMDASQIKSIELSNSRTAKDDAEGAGGIINIVLKKNRLEGFNGTFVASTAQASRFKANSSLNLNYRKNNTTLFGNYSYTDNKRKDPLRINRTIASALDVTTFDQVANMISDDRTHYYKFGVEQKTSASNTFMVQFNASNNNEDEHNPSKTWMGPLFGLVDSLMVTNTLQKSKFDRYSFNANNEYRLDSAGDKKIVADIDYSMFNTAVGTNYAFHTYYPNMEYIYAPEFQQSNSDVDIKIFATKVDFYQSIGKGKFSTGGKYSRVNTNNAIQFENLENESWILNTGRSNTFDYTEDILAGYVDYNTPWKKLDVKVGLRGEYTMSDGVSITEQKQVKRNYFNLFPSVSISHKVNDNHILSFNYSKKVSRPNYRNLNPFEIYIDKRTSQRGNPYLNPQFTNSFGLNYTLFGMYNIAIGHDITKDAMVESIGQDTINKSTWITRENLGKQSLSYLNLSMPFRITKYWSMYNNITGIYMHFEGPVSGYEVSQGRAFVQGNSTNTFKLNKQFTAEVNARYNSRFLYNVYEIQSRYSVDIGFNYALKDQRSSFKLAFTDIFHSDHNNVFTNFKEFNSKIYQYHDAQSVRLTFNYKFGNLKQALKRTDDSSEEKSRAL